LLLGFGDYVPLQKNNYLKNSPFYVIFTISFIMCGLIILASSTNLLVLYLVNINSEERLRKRMRLKQKKQEQLHKLLIGDVISAANKQDIVTLKDEAPNLAAFNEELSVCSCEDIKFCYKIYLTKVKNDTKFYFTHLRTRNIINNRLTPRAGKILYRSSELNFENRIYKNYFTVLRPPTKIAHLYRHNDKSDYVFKYLDKRRLSMRKLAYEADFISVKRIERRNSL
jgi:hypothetical protein